MTLQWRHNGCDGISNHQRLDAYSTVCSGTGQRKKSKICVTGLCEGNSPVTSEFPSQRASNAEIFPFDGVVMILCGGSYVGFGCWWLTVSVTIPFYEHLHLCFLLTLNINPLVGQWLWGKHWSASPLCFKSNCVGIIWISQMHVENNLPSIMIDLSELRHV